ncbi:MAG: putative selenate reductase subunit YgfK [Anaerolineae bacterium]|nr:putative selenate reductase subunit YgfK [Anaerolineae bacterium]
MSDRMNVQPLEVLLDWIVKEYEANQTIFGIHRSLFYTPRPDSPYAITDLFGHYLATPIGPGAGPHTQLAQNIVCAWLSGGRFIELKTVQIMDELEIPRPCIDMEDEGYNVEWSQELKLEQSASEYIKAWVLIHVLRRMLGFEGRVPFGTIFNMSVGYNLEGIQHPRMTRFMDRLQDASAEIAEMQALLEKRFPQFAGLDIPTRITNNVTLSTMHGCPPDEIEAIAKYLMEQRGLHTTVKLNPTLLGKDAVMHILHEHLGFHEIHIPDRVFDHDLQYDRAVELITSLQAVAAAQGLSFGIKLSNTLAMANHKGLLPGEEMYMSGRALYPITMNLFNKLAHEFNGALNVSYSAGADAFNLTNILACGARPVTVVSDLLKPGGYSRMRQYLENLEEDMQERGARNLEELAGDRLANLEREAARALTEPRYKKDYHPYGLPKVASGLGPFDCVVAPCVEQCAIRQDVPEYAWWIAQGEYDKALAVILARNPLPGVTGYACTHLCQTRCTRNNYDQPVAIRALKRFAAFKSANQQISESANQQISESANQQISKSAKRRVGKSKKVAIIGSGPSGLAAAWVLALHGVEVTIYEARNKPGGMLSWAIPPFRLPDEIVEEDIARLQTLGVTIELNHPIISPPEELLEQGFDAVYIATGMQKDARMGIAGEDGQGVYDALSFLAKVRQGERVDLGRRALVIGGGNSAIDAARAAKRLATEVIIVYRRTRAEMPAIEEEIKEALDEGVTLEELASPIRVILEKGRVVALECVRNRLGEPEADGRRRPVPIAGSEFKLEADSIIVAIGQRPEVTFLEGSAITLSERGTIPTDPQTCATSAAGIYAGGDIVRGPATIIEAIADGRRAAEAICKQWGLSADRPATEFPRLSEADIVALKQKRARKELQHGAALLPLEQRRGFELVEATLTEEAARREAARCLQCSALCDKCVEVCPNRANYAFFVTPVTYTLPRLVCRQGKIETEGQEVFHVTQSRQIIHVDDFCNECGNCATFCVHQGKPYTDKPRLFLQESDFALEEDNAFHIQRSAGGWTISSRQGGREARLSLQKGAVTFEDENLCLELSPENLDIMATQVKQEFAGEVSLLGVAEMYVILKGVTTSLPFLPFEM